MLFFTLRKFREIEFSRNNNKLPIFFKHILRSFLPRHCTLLLHCKIILKKYFPTILILLQNLHNHWLLIPISYKLQIHLILANKFSLSIIIIISFNYHTIHWLTSIEIEYIWIRWQFSFICSNFRRFSLIVIDECYERVHCTEEIKINCKLCTNVFYY